MLSATYFNCDGSTITSGAFSLITKSLYKALIDAQIITGLSVVVSARHFFVLGDEKVRLVVSPDQKSNIRTPASCMRKIK